MDIQNIQYYLYKDKANAAEVKVVKEDKLIKQLKKSGKFSNNIGKYILTKTFL